MGQRLSRSLGKLRDIRPGEYLVDRPCIFVSCPSCGGIDDISVTQPPAKLSGLVPGKWRCPTATCGYEEWLSLDWNEAPHR